MADEDEQTRILPSAIFEEIDDDIFKKLKLIFNFSGRGRRPALPVVTCNNKLLLQLFYLRGAKTWDTVVDFGSNLVDIERSKLRYLIERSHKDALTLSYNQLLRFLTVEVSAVGRHLQQLNISRHELLHQVPDQRKERINLTNGIMLDLVTFQKKESLPFSWIHQSAGYLSGRLLDELSLSKDLKKILETYRKKSKSRHRDKDAYEQFFLEQYLGSAETVQVSAVPTPLTPRKCEVPSCHKRIRLESVDSDAENSAVLPSTMAIKLKKLKGDLETKSQELLAEKEKSKTLEIHIKEKISQFEAELKTRNDIMKTSTRNLNIVERKLRKCQGNLEDKSKALLQKAKELSQIRHSAYYKRLKHLEHKLKMKEDALNKDKHDTSMQEIKTLKLKLGKTQTLLSNSRLRHKKTKEENNSLSLKIQKLEKEFLMTDGKETVLLKTREEHSNKFTTDIIKCVIALMGQTEVSGKNCGQVIDIVARNLFKVNLKPEDLPSERSSLRFADKGHVLAKHQIAETLLESKNADLHSDGTTRVHKKVVDHQLSTDSGVVLSCGFTPVDREDTNTLVDVAFNLLQEIADVFDEDETDDVFRGMLTNLTGLMSDHASHHEIIQQIFEREKEGNPNY